MKGIVRWYNDIKGFGFIQGDDGEDIIIRNANLPIGTNLYEGESVNYQTMKTIEGLQIMDVKKVKN